MGTWARAPPLAFERNFFFARLYVVWFGLVLCQTLNLAPFLQLYSLWNDTTTGYNGACAKVNVVFTVRRYALARSLLSTGVCQSCCLSATLAYCIQVAEDIIKQVFRPGSAIILVFLTPSADTQFQGEYVSLDAKYTGVGKICDFRLKSPFIS